MRSAICWSITTVCCRLHVSIVAANAHLRKNIRLYYMKLLSNDENLYFAYWRLEVKSY